jgi:hypothetical protein
MSSCTGKLSSLYTCGHCSGSSAKILGTSTTATGAITRSMDVVPTRVLEPLDDELFESVFGNHQMADV